MGRKISIAVVAGDGIGPEVTVEAIKVLRVAVEKHGVETEVLEFPYSADHFLKTGEVIPEEVFETWPLKFDAILLGAFGDPRVPADYAENILLGLRRRLDLFINFRPVVFFDDSLSPLKNTWNEQHIEFAVFRENTEGLYCGAGGMLRKRTKYATTVENSISTYRGVERIIRAGFAHAHENGKTSVVMVDKSNVLRHEGSLWMDCFNEIKEQYSCIEGRHMYVDRACMELVRDPGQFEVIVTSNMFGDIISDLAAQIQGGLGLAPSASYNPQHLSFAGVFEPVHGSAFDIAGRGIANPIGAILSVGLTLNRLGFMDISKDINSAVQRALVERKVTPDLGGHLTTSEVGDDICRQIKEGSLSVWEKR